MLPREELFRAEVAELGVIRIRRLPSARLLRLMHALPDRDAFALALVAESVMDEDGAPVFGSPLQVADLDATLARELAQACVKVNSNDEGSRAELARARRRRSYPAEWKMHLQPLPMEPTHDAA